MRAERSHSETTDPGGRYDSRTGGPRPVPSGGGASVTKNQIALAAAAGVLTTALVGGAALAAFQPFPSDPQTVPAADAASDKGPVDHLKAVLDPLVKKGTITQAQE